MYGALYKHQSYKISRETSSIVEWISAKILANR